MNPNRSFRVLGFLTFPLFLASFAAGSSSGEPDEGAVAEEIAPDSAVERAGIRAGDLLLSWSAGDGNSGPIRSPFELGQLEIERAPRGAVTLHGMREGGSREWLLPIGDWEIKARPTFPEDLLTLYLQGRDRIAAGDLEAGARHWRSAIEAANHREDHLRAAWLQDRLARELASAGRWSEADAAWEEAFQRLEGSQVAAAAQLLRDQYQDWGWETLERRNLWDRVEACYRRALALEPAESLVAAWDLAALGMIRSRRGELAAAEDLYLKAYALEERLIPESLEIAWTLTTLGNYASVRGDLSTAEERFQHALNLLERLEPNGIDFAWTLAQFGVLDMSRGNLAIAEERFRRALAIQEKLAPESFDIAKNLINLGSVSERRSDFAAAEEYYQRALDIHEKLAASSHDSTNSTYSLWNLAAVEKRKGNLAKADDYLKRVLEILDRRSPKSYDTAMACFHRASIAIESGNLALAEELHGRALAILEKQSPGSIVVSDSLEGLGTVAFKRGSPTKAEELFRRALAIREKLAPGSTRVGLSLNDLGKVYRRTGRLSMAAEHFCSATDTFDQQRATLGGTIEGRPAFGGAVADYCWDCIAALVDLGRPEEAFKALERGRARSFLDMLAERDMRLAELPTELARNRKQTNADYDRTQATLARLNPEHDQAEINRLLVQLREIRASQEEIAAKVRLASPRTAALHNPQLLDLAGARAALDPGTVLLEYAVGPERTWLFVVQSSGTAGSGLSAFRIAAGAKTLRKEVEGFSHLLGHPRSDRATLQARARRLYNLLVRPAAGQIARAQRILVSPDGPLHTLPFAALMRGNQYLVDWKPIHSVLSATVYAEIKRSRPAQHDPAEERLIAFGDPAYPSTAGVPADPEVREAVRRGLTLKPLPSSRKEVEAIAALYPHAQAYLGQEATEEKAKSLGPDSRIVHFACHGLLDERFPLNSALALTLPEHQVEGKDNGLLQAWEIFESVRLDADLVTLSACDTALGKEMGGEGLVGLTRAFQYAGARSVLASLWGVADFSTARFMKRFYGYLRSGKAKDEALRAAQVDTIREKSGSSHPFHWAAFELFGDWR